MIAKQEGSGRKGLLTHQIRTIVEESMDKDDETTACQLYKILRESMYRVNLYCVGEGT